MAPNTGVADRGWPLYSQPNGTKDPELNQCGVDLVTAMGTGREPLTSLDTFIKDWKSRGGDQVRQEFQTALKG